mgnify:CR=1 FL=1
MGFRLHPSVCRLLLCGGAPWAWSHDDVRALDPQLYQHKVRRRQPEPLTLTLTTDPDPDH